ncbi:MAG: PAS domain S-box protein [Deltaproteobacteria bacterium]|nr:MAG: PAS domain S-box protein [Deltaproteobacteria bacterium]
MNEQADKTKEGKAEFYVVGVGASAGGLEALELFFHEMPIDTGAAFVVVQHLSPDFKSHMQDLLSRQTKMPVHRATNGMQLEPNNVYLLPPKMIMIVSGGQLLLTEKEASGWSYPIDIFFRSLAQDCRDHAVAVVLSGAGSDGALGIRDVHSAGGLVLVQDEGSAKFNGMPINAIETGVADLILQPQTMGQALERYIHNAVSPAELIELEFPQANEQGIKKLFMQLQVEHGIDFSHYKPSMVYRRIRRRATMARQESLAGYFQFVQDHPEEVDDIYKDLLIGVTKFFRDEEAFHTMEKEVIPAILRSTPKDETIRVWVAGCATGEEAYSIAILFHEQMTKAKHPLSNIKIFATDVHRASLHQAASGVYPSKSLSDVPPYRRQTYFDRVDEGFQVSQSVRQMIVFAPHNLLRDAPFTQLSLVTCRNLLIYLSPQTQKRIHSLFHFSLRTNGFLFLGPSETPGDLQDEYEATTKRWKIFRKRRDIQFPHAMRFPSSKESNLAPSNPLPSPSRSYVEPRMMGFLERLLEEHMVPSFLVSEQLELLHTFGGGEQFLRVPGGRATKDIRQLVAEELKTSVTGALNHCSNKQELVQFQGIRAKTEEGSTLLTLTASPVRNPRTRELQYLLKLEPFVQLQDEEESDNKDNDVNMDQLTKDHIRSLELELRFTRENLQATIEELEAANEELQSTNEELIASNEELQSTNEELQSVNEELFTVNAEHQTKIDELILAQDDMDNLLATTDVGVLFLDEELCIRRFTPALSRSLHLRSQDLGRRFTNFLHLFLERALLEQIQGVQDTRESKELEVHLQNDIPYLLRIQPYTTNRNVGGVVLTLINVQAVKQTAEEVLQFKHMSEQAADGHVLFHESGQVTYMNPTARELLGYNRSEMLPLQFNELFPSLTNDSFQFPETLKELPKIKQRAFESILSTKNQTALPVETSFSRFEANNTTYLFATFRDITERLEQNQILQKQLSQYQLAMEAGKMAAWEWYPHEGRLESTDDFRNILGLSPTTPLSTLDDIVALAIPEDQVSVQEKLELALNKRVFFDIRFRRRVKGKVRYIRTKGRVERDSQKQPLRVVGISWDNTKEQMNTERLEILARVMEKTSDFVGITDPKLNISYLNTSARQMIGLPSSVEASDFDLEMFQPKWAYDLLRKQGIPHAIREGSWSKETALLSQEGEEIPVLQSLLTHRDKKGELLQFSTIMRDIRIQKQVQQTIEESAAFLQNTLDSLFAFVGVCTPEGTLIEINQAALKATGLDSTNVLGRDFADIHWWSYSTEAQEKLQHAITQALRGEVVRFDTKILNAKGVLLPIDLQITAMRDPDGTITHLIPSAIDISERQRFEDQLRSAEQEANAANQAKSAFLANISHELRTPLTAILGYSELLLNNLPLLENESNGLSVPQAASIIQRNGNYLLELVNDILDLSKVEAEQIDIEIAPFNLQQLLRELLNSMKLRAEEKVLPLNIHYSSKLPRTICTDEIRLRQILVNLLTNAIKFTSQGYVELRVECFVNPDSPNNVGQANGPFRLFNAVDEPMHLSTDLPLALRLQVIDTGMGISHEMQKKLFQPFTQAAEARHYGGSGLGLSISQRLAQKMGGNIVAHSQEGKGSTFSLWLPVYQPPEDMEFLELRESHSPEGDGPTTESRQLEGHILIVDDHKDVQDITRRIIEQAGLQTSIANDGQEAVDMVNKLSAEDTPPDIILMDMHMPKLNGYDATQKLREQGLKTPIIAITAGAMKGDREKCIEAGCDDYLPKPIHSSKLLSVLRTYLEKQSTSSSDTKA